MMEVGRIFQIAERRHAVRLGAAVGGRRGPKPRRAQRADAETEHMPAGELRHARNIPQDRLPILAALSASYHHSDGKPGAAIFRQRLGVAEAVPARVAREAVGELRHDVEIPQQHAVERPGRGDQRRRDPWRRSPSRSARRSPGFLMPMVLREPGWSAACEPQNSRCSLPGDSDCPQRSVMISKSKLRSRFWYCASSTMRIDDGDADALQRRLVEQRDPLGRRILHQDFDGDRLAGWHRPACARAPRSRLPSAAAVASRRLARTASGLPPTGLV